MSRHCRYLALLLLATAACRRPEEAKGVIIATTPEVAATRLPAQLAKTFGAEAHVDVQVQVVAEPALPGAIAAKKADVAIVGTPELLAATRAAGPAPLVSTFAYDDFLIIGPRNDPARVKRADAAADAFRSIARRNSDFCSPVDVVVFREREMEIWTAAAIDLSRERRIRPCQGDPATVLRETARRNAYTITDRATYDSVRPAKLDALLQNTPMLHNDYTVLLVTSPGENPNAEWFVQWLMSYRGRDFVENYRFDGGRRLYPTEAP